MVVIHGVRLLVEESGGDDGKNSSVAPGAQKRRLRAPLHNMSQVVPNVSPKSRQADSGHFALFAGGIRAAKAIERGNTGYTGGLSSRGARRFAQEVRVDVAQGSKVGGAKIKWGGR
jgi:hypothetical protein